MGGTEAMGGRFGKYGDTNAKPKSGKVGFLKQRVKK